MTTGGIPDASQWPYTTDPYKAAWADVFRYSRPMATTVGDDDEDLLDVIARKYGLDDPPTWGPDDPLDRDLC